MILVEENTSIFEIPYSTFEIHKVFQKSQINILQSLPSEESKNEQITLYLFSD